jgi:RNA polymerase sigma-70 factor (ECF subfamily)
MAMEQTRLVFLPSLHGTRAEDRAAERPAELSKDASVFWELAGPHKSKLYNFISKSLSFSEEADDVFQETLLRGLKYFESYRREQDFGAWIFAIAHNEVRKYFRNNRRGRSAPFEEGLIVHDEHVRQDLVSEVYRFAKGLKPKSREIFFLFYDSGFSVSEISRVTGVREGNVKFILNQARNLLRKCFGELHEKS